jgi:hypothetical protein
MGYCEGELANSTLTKEKTAAYNNSAGIGTAGIIGIELSAQTGYSAETKIDYAFHAQGHLWCGYSDYPANGNSRLQTIHAGVFNGG